MGTCRGGKGSWNCRCVLQGLFLYTDRTGNGVQIVTWEWGENTTAFSFLV